MAGHITNACTGAADPGVFNWGITRGGRVMRNVRRRRHPEVRMPMYFGSRNGLKPNCDFTAEEAEQLIDGEPAEEIGEPTEFIDEVMCYVDELLLEDSDGLECPMIFQWDFETTGRLWRHDLRARAYNSDETLR